MPLRSTTDTMVLSASKKSLPSNKKRGASGLIAGPSASGPPVIPKQSCAKTSKYFEASSSTETNLRPTEVTSVRSARFAFHLSRALPSILAFINTATVSTCNRRTQVPPAYPYLVSRATVYGNDVFGSTTAEQNGTMTWTFFLRLMISDHD